MENIHKKYLNMAVDLGFEGMNARHGGPFGAVIVKGHKVIGKGFNSVTSLNDPTAHAEVVAIREACKELKDFQLNDCVIYSSCEPCPMCLGAIYWARPKAIYFALSRKNAAEIEFDDEYIYKELQSPIHQRSIPTHQVVIKRAFDLFKSWNEKEDKHLY